MITTTYTHTKKPDGTPGEFACSNVAHDNGNAITMKFSAGRGGHFEATVFDLDTATAEALSALGHLTPEQRAKAAAFMLGLSSPAGIPGLDPEQLAREPGAFGLDISGDW